MGSHLYTRIIPTIAALALAVTPATAGASKNYALNGASGDYAPAVVHKNYALNGATGNYTPATHSTAPSVRVVRVTENSGFAWSDAAVGAASAVLMALLIALGIHRVRGRRIPAPSPARPTAT